MNSNNIVVKGAGSYAPPDDGEITKNEDLLTNTDRVRDPAKALEGPPGDGRGELPKGAVDAGV